MQIALFADSLLGYKQNCRLQVPCWTHTFNIKFKSIHGGVASNRKKYFRISKYVNIKTYIHDFFIRKTVFVGLS